jgi:hypothetical protein
MAWLSQYGDENFSQLQVVIHEMVFNRLAPGNVVLAMAQEDLAVQRGIFCGNKSPSSVACKPGGFI